MDAIVCVKQIPDPETPAAAFKVDEAAMQVLPAQGISPVISPFDAQPSAPLILSPPKRRTNSSSAERKN